MPIWSSSSQTHRCLCNAFNVPKDLLQVLLGKIGRDDSVDCTCRVRSWTLRMSL